MIDEEQPSMQGYEWSMTCGNCNDSINIRGMGYGFGKDTMKEGRSTELQSGNSVTCPHCNTIHVISISTGVGDD